jgi:hypothetical protein
MSEQANSPRDVRPPGPPTASNSSTLVPVFSSRGARAARFKALVAQRWFAVLICGGLGGLIGFLWSGADYPGIGLCFTVLVVTAGLGLLFRRAGEDSDEAFFESYAQRNGLVRSNQVSIPPGTPLFRVGDEREVKQAMRGRLAPDLEGTLALYTYFQNGSDCPFTLAYAEIPEAADFCSELICSRRRRVLTDVKEVSTRIQPMHFESTLLEAEYEIFVGPDQDQNWIHRLFSPSFIVWLAEFAPRGLAFELQEGALCCDLEDFRKDDTHLDELRESIAVIARRVREEVAESSPPA